MSSLANESLIFMIYLKFRVQQFITCQGFFTGKGLNSRIKIQKYPIFTEENNVIKVKYAIHFQIISFMVQNKTQIASNTHRYKKIKKKIFTWKSNHTYNLICQDLSYTTFFIKKLSNNKK